MKIALEEAQDAYRRGEVPVGAVLVHEGNILARAHNSPIMRNDPIGTRGDAGFKAGGEKIGNYRLAARSFTLRLNHVLCARAQLFRPEFRACIFGARDPKCGAVVSLYNILTDERLNHQVEITEGILPEECGEIISRFFQQKRIIPPLRQMIECGEVPKWS